MSLTKPSLARLFLVREGLVSDIPAGDGKTANLFLQCSVHCIVYNNQNNLLNFCDVFMPLACGGDPI